MQYRIESNRLVMIATDEERRQLAAVDDESPDLFLTDDFMHDLFENLICNDCFTWIDSSITRDMTSAPMLAFLGDDEEAPADWEGDNPPGLVLAGCWGEPPVPRYQPVLYRWAFMGYMVSTPQRDLMLTGEAVWQGGALLVRPEQEIMLQRGLCEGEVTLRFRS